MSSLRGVRPLLVGKVIVYLFRTGVLSEEFLANHFDGLILAAKFLGQGTTYAYNTCTSVSHKLLSKVKMMLEEDAKNVLRFMASNGLVANASKTALMFLNLKHSKKNELI